MARARSLPPWEARSPWARAPGSPFQVGSTPESLAIADFNQDRILDLAVANVNSNTITLLQGNGAGGFSPLGNPLPVGTNPFSVVAGDFNRDGKPDLAVANYGDSTVTV